MEYQIGKIRIKTNNVKLATLLVKTAKPVKSHKNKNIEIEIDRYCDELSKKVVKPVRTEQNARFEAKLKVLKQVFKGKRFHRRTKTGLRLSEVEKQVLHHKYGINFRTLNDFRAQAWSQLSIHKLAEDLR